MQPTKKGLVIFLFFFKDLFFQLFFDFLKFDFNYFRIKTRVEILDKIKYACDLYLDHNLAL
jgi:hypothetical protein